MYKGTLYVSDGFLPLKEKFYRISMVLMIFLDLDRNHFYISLVATGYWRPAFTTCLNLSYISV